jgi:hypothetical protein
MAWHGMAWHGMPIPYYYSASTNFVKLHAVVVLSAL